MKTLQRKLLRELRGSIGLLLVITSILAIGVGAFICLRSLHRNLSEAKLRYFTQCRMADFSIELKKMPLSELARLRELPGVGELRARIHHYVTVDLEHKPRLLNGLVLSLPDRREPVIDDIVLRSGSYFSDRRENEVIVNEGFARWHGLQPGQWIHLFLNNRRQEFLIVGTAISSEFIYLVGPGTFTPDPEHFGVFYLKQTYAEDVFDSSGAANQVLGRLARGALVGEAVEESHTSVPGVTREILSRAENLLAPYGVLGTTALAEQASNRYVSHEIKQLKTVAVVIPTIFLIVVVLVLNVLLTRMVEHQRVVAGTLKALGYSDAQLFFHFLQYGLAVGLCGGLAGCALGYYLARLMTGIYQTFYQFPDLENRLYLDIHLLTLGIGVFCALIGCLRGSRAVLRLRPAEAMRAKPPVEGRPILLERITWLWRRLSSSWRLVLRDLVRTRTRTIAGILAAALGSAVLVNTLMMSEAVRMLIDFQFHQILHGDLELTLKDEKGIDVLHEAARLPGVEHAEPVFDVAGTFYNGPHRKKGSITGLAPGARLTTPRDSAGGAIRVPPVGVALSRTLAEMLHVRRGETIAFQSTRGLRTVHNVPVVEISDSHLGMAVYANIHWLSRLMDEELAVTAVQLTCDQRPQSLAALHRELKQLPAIQGISARGEMIRNLEDTIVKTLWVSLSMLIGFACLIFFGSILNSSLVSLAEREREMATLRVLGYGPWELGGLMARESFIVSLIGTLLGMPLGFWLTEYSVGVYNNELFRIPVVTSPAVWTWTLAAAVVSTTIAHAVVQREIHRMDWLAALQAKE